IERFLLQQQLLTTSSRTTNVECWEYPSLCQLPIQVQLHIACTFKFFIDNVIYTRTGFHQRRRKNGQASTFLYVARCTEEPLWTMECRWIDTPRQRSTGRWYN